MIPGWDKALRSMTVGERAIVRITDPALAYGSVGIPTLVPPESPIELDILLLDAQPPTLNIDFDSIAMADNTPVGIFLPAILCLRFSSPRKQLELSTHPNRPFFSFFLLLFLYCIVDAYPNPNPLFSARHRRLRPPMKYVCKKRLC